MCLCVVCVCAHVFECVVCSVHMHGRVMLICRVRAHVGVCRFCVRGLFLCVCFASSVFPVGFSTETSSSLQACVLRVLCKVAGPPPQRVFSSNASSSLLQLCSLGEIQLDAGSWIP